MLLSSRTNRRTPLPDTQRSSYTPRGHLHTNGDGLAGGDRRVWLQSPPDDKGVRVDHLTVSLDSPRNAPSLSSRPTAPAAA